MEMVIGRIPVLEALRARKRRPLRLYLLETGQDLDEIKEAARGVSYEKVSRQQLDKLSKGAMHQGVILEAENLPLHKVENWVRGTVPDDAVVVILDSVEDPHNFGAIVRSAAACGANAVVFAKDRSAPLSSTAAKSAAGAMEYIDLVETVNISRAIQLLQEAGFWVAALEADAKMNLWQADLKGRIGLVIGSEGKGIRRLVRERCDFSVSIPITGPISSLNASASAAIALAECLRQRHQGTN